ncbi:SDR family NAD(P)-dependent oxidoreductase [Paenibacillus spongiae]|uniref:SDR family oxidoreductase n=1 Tax=Paenibacillus spongiae TaxID=2909671 RepID=A0ABY5SL65_9BACL|nr:SDR family NAD(P)-dependent oxidoreductase [Paenibacillus spongiae]UVI33255.1 SDR family oxidoreductase [Paenibacillus spongiae]
MIIDLKGKVAIITGAGRGIGLEIARTLASEGVITVLLDVSERLLVDAAKALADEGVAAYPYVCDVRDNARIEEVIEDVRKRHGRIDILVNNAGVANGGPVDELKEEIWDLNMDINLKGTFLMSKAIAPIMKEQRSGRIINAASFAAIVPSFGSAAYASSKAAVHQFTRVLAGELGPWNITVNCYSPGMIPTDMNHFAELPEDRQQRLLDTLTLRHWGKKEDVAHLICFLSSDYAGYITGTMIDVSGGKLATQIPRVAYEMASQQGSYTF